MARIPISIGTGALKEQNLIVGIDLGTTNSLIAKMHEGRPVALADIDRETVVPSIVHFAPGGQVIVGEDARPFLETDPQNTVYSIKRLMGKSFNDVEHEAAFFSYELAEDSGDGLVKIEVQGQKFTPVEISAFILKELKARAEHRLKTEIRQAVVTVPAYFNEAQRQATRDAGKLAGLDVLRIVNEPTAAALAYGLGIDPNEEKTVAVFDLGGGTFDVTLLKIENGVFEVLAANGDAHLGGDDFDRVLLEHWLKTLPFSRETLLKDREALQHLRLLAEEAKKWLTDNNFFSKDVEIRGQLFMFSIEREEFENMTRPLVERALARCRAALKDAELLPQDIDEVILVGGSTRQPLVKEMVGRWVGKRPHDELNPDEVVALGAAVQADILAGNRKDWLLLDVTPLSLGLETAGGLMDTLIPRNSRIPIRVSRRYTTSVDGQVNLKIAVYQGERELAADNRKLAEFELRGIPAMPAGLPKVEITFALDADGLLKVEAKELHSGLAQEIAVKPSYGLTDEEMEKMLEASFLNAQSDMERRLLLETVQKGKQMAYYAEQFARKNAAYFAPPQTETLQDLLQKLRNAFPSNDKQQIQQAIDNLDAFTRPIAQQVMDQAVKAAIVGTEAK